MPSDCAEKYVSCGSTGRGERCSLWATPGLIPEEGARHNLSGSPRGKEAAQLSASDPERPCESPAEGASDLLDMPLPSLKSLGKFCILPFKFDDLAKSFEVLHDKIPSLPALKHF